jgi:CheY-like chemotaxis protein
MSTIRNYLVVDDNEPLADNLAEILNDVGARVTIATSGEVALAQVAEMQFDALLTDMRMPGMGGLELLRLAKRIDPELPVAVMTAFATDRELDAARAEGVRTVFPKPLPIAGVLVFLAGARRPGPPGLAAIGGSSDR